MFTTFQDLENASAVSPNRPFFAIDLTNDDEVLNWLKNELVSIKNRSTTRLEKAKNNYLRYKGLQYFNAVYYPRDVLETQKKYTPQLVLPLISDYIDDRVSLLMEKKPFVTPIPHDDETKDKVDAKVAKKFLKHIEHKEKLDRKFQKLIRNSKVTGESFVWTRWNPDLGEPVKIKLNKTQDGQNVAEGLFQGDVECLNKTVNSVFYQQAESWEKVDYCFVEEFDYIEALKMDYPDKAGSIQQDTDHKVFNYDTMEEVDFKGMTRKIHFYHKKTKYLPEGFEACFVVNCALLKKGPLSYKHGQLPIDRLIDVENDEEVAGQSSIDKVRGIASNANNVLNAMVKMFMLAGFSKWFVEGGSIDPKQLNNDVNIVTLKPGSKSPVLAQANPVGQGHFEFVDKMIGWFYKFAKSNSIIQGEPPAGVTAGVALQYVSESENRRTSTEVANFQQAVRSVYEKALSVCGQYYRPDDERTLLLLGKDGKWEREPLDLESIAKPYSIEIQSTTNLSDSKAVMIQQVIDLGDKYPDLLPREQIIEMTGLAQADKAYDVASVAARSAEDENEKMQDTGVLIEPEEFEDHLTHWRIHMQSIQPMGFKQNADEAVKQAMYDHIAATEFLMMQQAAKNPMYQEALKTLIGFPAFMPLPLVEPIPESIGPALNAMASEAAGIPPQQPIQE